MKYTFSVTSNEDTSKSIVLSRNRDSATVSFTTFHSSKERIESFCSSLTDQLFDDFFKKIK